MDGFEELVLAILADTITVVYVLFHLFFVLFYGPKT